MKRKPISITDHAVLKHLERVEGIDVDAIRQRVRRIVSHADEHSGCSAVTKDGFRYVIYDGAVVTVKAIHRAKGRALPTREDENE